jgi:S1-C subfamily serine protease
MEGRQVKPSGRRRSGWLWLAVVALLVVETVAIAFVESVTSLPTRVCEQLMEPAGREPTAAPPGAASVPALDRAGVRALDAGSIQRTAAATTVLIGAHRRFGLGPLYGNAAVLSADGLLVAPQNDVFEADAISAYIGPALYRVALVGTNPSDDVAVLQVEDAPPLTPARFAPVFGAQAGDAVFAVENSGHAGVQVWPGKVTDTDFWTPVHGADDWPGVTGVHTVLADGQGFEAHAAGPLVDAGGRVLGLVIAVSGTSAYAVTAEEALTDAGQIAGGRASGDSSLGLWATLGAVTIDAAGDPAGAQVVSLRPGTPAQCLGLRSGDVIDEVGATSVNSSQGLSQALFRSGAGTRIQISWVRPNGRRHTATVTLAAGTGP